jgi:DNA-binding transcriptional MerR regulator
VTVRALRYYEKAGLVAPTRLPNGYREYDPVAVRQVQQIRRLMGLGFAVEETRPFVECLADGHESGDECPASMAGYRHAIDHLSERIRRLVECRDALVAHLEDAAGTAMPANVADGADDAPGRAVQPRSDMTLRDDHVVGQLVESRLPTVMLPGH